MTKPVITTNELIEQLQTAKAPDRRLDVLIALHLGYRRHIEGPESKPTKILWLLPNADQPGTIPEFTFSIEAAYDLSQQLIPGNIGGVTWGGHPCKARIGDGPYYTANTPALALCAAALGAVSDLSS